MTLVYSFLRESGNPDIETDVEMLKSINNCLQTEQSRKMGRWGIDQFMFRRILNCEYYFISPWWDEVSLNAKDLVSVTKTK